MLPNSSFNFLGFEDEEAMVAALQAAENSPLGCFRNGAGEQSHVLNPKLPNPLIEGRP